MIEIILKIVNTIILTASGGILYRIGGAAGFNTKYRDFGVPAIMLLIMVVWGQYFNWQSCLGLFISFGALFGAQTTYWGFVNKWFKADGDKVWYNWAFTGFGYSLALLPLIVAQNWPGTSPGQLQTHYSGFFIRMVVCSGLTALWSELIGNAVVEEVGRGVIELVTLPLLFIG